MLALLTPLTVQAVDQTLEERVSALEDLRISGSVRMNYTVQDWNDAQTDRGGDFRFNTLTLGIDTQHRAVRLSAQYRWYDAGNGAMIHHAYFATDLNEQTEIQVGITKVPFGILPYESHSYWSDASLYLGFNDDYDSGVKVLTKAGRWDLQAAYFASGDAAPTDPQRFSFDVVSDTNNGPQQNQETHQLNLRAAYALQERAEAGVSVQYGGLYNQTTRGMGSVAAAALHYTASYGRFGVETQLLRYVYSAENPAGVSRSSVQLGGFGATYLAAARANIAVFNLSYDLPWEGGIVNQVRLYNDWNRVYKDQAGFSDSQINTLGIMVVTGELYTNFDITSARNVPFIGPGDYKTAFAAGDGSNGRHTFFNIQLGYYF